MRDYDFHGVFGSTPAEFKKTISKTLEQLEEKDMKVQKTSMKILLIAALIALLAGTAFALTRGASVLDMRQGALPEAREAVTDISEIAAFESPLVRYRPVEALIDQGKLLLVVEATPIDPDKYRIADGWGDTGEAGDASALTPSEIAKREGKTLLCAQIDVKVNGKDMGSGSIGATFKDNVQTIWQELEMPQGISTDELEIALTGYDYELLTDAKYRWEGDVARVETPEVRGEQNVTEKTFSIRPTHPASNSVRFEGPFEMEYITVDWVEIDRTAVSLGMKLQYTLHEDLTEDIVDELTFMSVRLADPAGVKDVRKFEYDASSWLSYPLGAQDDWAYDEDLIVKGTFIEESVWPAISEWPEKFELVAFYKGLGEWSAPVELWVRDAVGE